MFLPQNGRIVIVDDSLIEAQPLFNILSKKRIPFNYYSGTKSEEFPDNPNENKLRVLFLDLNIFELTTDVKSVISALHPIIKSIVPDNPNPYLLIIWSKKSDEYKNALEEHFRISLPAKGPAKIIFLHKTNYFDYIEEKWVPQADCLIKLNKDLINELNNISLLGNLISWENIIHKNSSISVNEFATFFPIDSNWDKNTKAIIYRLAKAVVGDEDIQNLKDEDKLAEAFLLVNSFLFDKVENEVKSRTLGSITGISDTSNISETILGSINSILHTSSKDLSINNLEQGNIYFIPNKYHQIEKIIWDKKFKPAILREEIISSKPNLVQLDITPVCDYSQNKGYVRIIHGVLLPYKYYKTDMNKEFYYRTPYFIYNNEVKFILFDFRFMKTFSKHYIIRRRIIPSIKLRKELSTDIQAKLANQVNRPGISNV